MNADEFNALYEVGVPVFAYPGGRPEGDRKATRLVTRTRSKASVLGGHTDVVWVDGHSACIALSHVDVVSQSVFEAALLADAVATQGALPMPIAQERSELDQARDDVMGACLARWEEEQENARLRLALKSARRGRRELRARLTELEALDLCAVDGRVSATCEDPAHPTWLRATDDQRGCPWCRIAALEAALCVCQTVRQPDGSILHAADCPVFAIQLGVAS